MYDLVVDGFIYFYVEFKVFDYIVLLLNEFNYVEFLYLVYIDKRKRLYRFRKFVNSKRFEFGE